ncbi:hypothetical protein DLAC_07953 [Tieghemostelium lacteum]|uniref:Profilin n=1 Tax=Tieghemostelium lacteum TaxID=361077 RepID=A0A151ZAS6_TIELA|nr:hypothetical protein DLAC_07953 [Tieghemostelium lacteum]|eukprot:KYQ91050.1 hypothetical protein DLAC_07953 [Tieghemostelium lacteum]
MFSSSLNQTPPSLNAGFNSSNTFGRTRELNTELLEKLTSTPVPIILPPSLKPEAKYEKYVNQLVGKAIMSAAIISKTPGKKLKNMLLTQKGLLIKGNEILQLIDYISKGTLQSELISISGTKYIITTVKERSYYGSNTNLNIGGGIIIVVLDKVILVALYPNSVPMSESVPYLEKFVLDTVLN